MEQDEKIARLEAENRALAEKIARYERESERLKTVRRKLAKSAARFFTGRPLRDSVSRLVDEAFRYQLEKETVKDVLYSALHRLTRVGLVSLILAMVPLTLALLQTYYLKKQNEKLDFQNRRIEQQTFLQEAERRSSLVFLFDNVLDQIDEELKGKTSARERRLSPQLIGRIVALSLALKPYRYLDGDTITLKPISPERGQLLMGLIISDLSSTTYDQIFTAADFSYTALQNISLDGKILRNINLSHAFIENVTLVGADVSNANFTGAEFHNVRAFLSGKKNRGARFDYVQFQYSQIDGADFSFCSFKQANFTKSTLKNVFFQDAFFSDVEWVGAMADSLDFKRAKFLKANFTLSCGMNSISPANFGEAMMDTATLHTLQGLPRTKSLDIFLDKPNYIIHRDTPYIDEQGRPYIVADSVTIYPVK